ncbi:MULTISPECIES: hypothetical protein [Cupriavidus]
MSIQRTRGRINVCARLFALLLFLSAADHATAGQAPCGPEKTRVVNNQLMTCINEENAEFSSSSITPPPPSALRVALDEVVRTELTAVRPTAWPVRAVLWNWDSKEHWAEFDRQGNLLRSNFVSSAGSDLREYRREGVPVWMGGQHVYAIVSSDASSAPDPQRADFVLANGRVCPALPIDTGYEYYRRMYMGDAEYLSGNCDKAIRQHRGARDFWVYPEDARFFGSNFDVPPMYWTIQYFADPVTQLVNTAGACVLYCDAPRQIAGSSKTAAVDPVHGRFRIPALDLRPPPKNALRKMTLEERALQHRDQGEFLPVVWPVRALFNSRSGIFAFDHQGNVINGQGTTPYRALEIRYGQDGAPLWTGAQKIYWLRAPDTPSDDSTASLTKTGIVVADGHACPTQLVSEAYGILHEQGAVYLNGNCASAVRRVIGTGTFWVYPEDAKTEHPQYWVVQYFDDPVTPILDAEGQCWFYCDGRR